MMNLARAALGIVCLALVACDATERTSTLPDRMTVGAELDSFWRSYEAAVTTGDVAALGALHADSVFFVESGAPTLRGRAALEAYFAEGFKAVRYSGASMRPDQTEWMGDHVLQLGTFGSQFLLQGQAQAAYGRFAGIFQRDGAGAWKLLRLVAVTDSTVPQASTKSP